jgi:hypothetical protein
MLKSFPFCFRVEEIETPAILHAWYLTLDFIEALQPTKIVTGHIESGWEMDPKEDMAYMRKYLDLFSSKITNAPVKPTVEDLYQTFKTAFPQVSFRCTSAPLTESYMH